jgi:DNA/RNA-binding domain of Phe-tRNA-synthetase-like protein
VRFRIHPEIFDAFPGLHIGVVRARGIDNRGDSTEIQPAIRKIQEEIRQRFDLETLSQCAKIQNWRKAYALFGAKPKKHRSSVESLYRMVLEGKGLPSINRIVDLYNYVSLVHMVPVGGDDLAGVEGDILLRFAAGDEVFRPLGSAEEQKARKGEVIYADEKEVLCRRWNWRECEKTKMTRETRDVILVTEGLPPVTIDEINGAVLDMKELVQNHCGGKAEAGILYNANRECEI